MGKKNLEFALRYSDTFGFSVSPVILTEDTGIVLINRSKPTIKQVHDTFLDYPEAGVAIMTGNISSLIILVVDLSGGCKTIKKNKFDLPETVVARLGDDFEYWYFKFPRVFDNVYSFTAEEVGLSGFEVRGDGDYVYAPPTSFSSGETYSFVDGMGLEDTTIVDAPDWLIEVISDNRGK